MQISGFYSLAFSAQLPGFGAVVIIDNGTVRGADSQYLYVGTVEQSGDALKVQLYVKAHAEAAKVLFSDIGGAFSLELEGTGNELAFCVAGPSPLPHAAVTVTGHRIAKLDLN